MAEIDLTDRGDMLPHMISVLYIFLYSYIYDETAGKRHALSVTKKKRKNEVYPFFSVGFFLLFKGENVIDDSPVSLVVCTSHHAAYVHSPFNFSLLFSTNSILFYYRGYFFIHILAKNITP